MNVKKIIDTANLYQKYTGIPGRVCISSAVPRHVPMLKYTIDDEELSISIDETPKVLAPKV